MAVRVVEWFGDDGAWPSSLRSDAPLRLRLRVLEQLGAEELLFRIFCRSAEEIVCGWLTAGTEE